LFTFLPIEKISMVMQAQRIDPSKRIAHHLLAKEVVELAHGAMKAKDAEQGHKHAFSFGANNYNLQVLRTKLATAANEDGPEESMGRHARDIEYMQYKKQFALAAGGTFPAPTATKPTTTKDNMITLPHTFIMDCTFPQLLYATGMVSSKSEAQRLIQSKGAYVVLPNSGAQETPFNLLWDKIADGALPKNYLVDFEALVLRTGKTNMRICRIVKTEDFEAKGLDFPGWEDFKARKGKSNLEETLKSSAVLEKPTQ
jgi:tyrosyl-tRNA synthetase